MAIATPPRLGPNKTSVTTQVIVSPSFLSRLHGYCLHGERVTVSDVPCNVYLIKINTTVTTQTHSCTLWGGGVSWGGVMSPLGLGLSVLLRPGLWVLLMELEHHRVVTHTHTHLCPQSSVYPTHTHTHTSAMNSRILVLDTSASAR